MARISTYVNDTSIQDNDRLLGTDAVGGGTKNFTVAELAAFIQDGTVVPDAVPRQFMPVVNQEGTDIEMSLITNVHSGVSALIDLTAINPETQDRRNEVFMTLGQNGQVSIVFRNYNDFYYLPSFVSKTFTGSIIGTQQIDYSGIITSYEGFNVRSVTNTAGSTTYYTDFTFNATLDASSSVFTDQGDERPQFDTLNISNLTVVNTEFVGRTIFAQPTVFNDALDVNASIDLRDTLNILDGDGIVFGSSLTEPGQVILATDGSNLVFGGGGNIIVDTGGQFSVRDVAEFQEDVTLAINDRGEFPDLIIDGGNIQLHEQEDGTGGNIQTFNADGLPLPEIKPTIPNGVGGDDQGLLTSIQYGVGAGAQNWHVLPTTSSVAQVVPGLLEELSPLAPGSDANRRTILEEVVGSAGSPATVAVLDSVEDLIPNLYFTLDGARRTITSVQEGDPLAQPNPIPSSITFTPGVENVVAPQTVINDLEMDTAQFFYGTDLGTEVTFRSNVTTNPTALDIPINATRRSVGVPGASTPATRTLNSSLVDAFGNIPQNQRLFFSIGESTTLPANIEFRYNLTEDYTAPVTITVSDGTNTDIITYVDGVTGPYDLTNITTATSGITAQIAAANIDTFDYIQGTAARFDLNLADGAFAPIAVGSRLLVQGENFSGADLERTINITDITQVEYTLNDFREVISVRFATQTGNFDLLNRGQVTITDFIGPRVVFRYGLELGDVVVVTQGANAPETFIATAGQTEFLVANAAAVTSVTVNGDTPEAFIYNQETSVGSALQNIARPNRIILQNGRSFGEEIRFVQSFTAGRLVFITPPAAGTNNISIQGSNALQFQEFSGNGIDTDFDLTTFTEAVGVVMVDVAVVPSTEYSIAAATIVQQTIPVTETGQTVFEVGALITGVPVRIDVFSPGTRPIIDIPVNMAAFLAATPAGPVAAGDTVAGIVFEVTNYDAIDFDPNATTTIVTGGEIEFSLLSEGNLQVSSDRFTVNSELHLPNLPQADPTSQNLLFRDPTSGIVSTGAFTSVAGAEAQVRYCPVDDPTDLTNLSEIHFEGATAASGIVTVGGGRFSFSTGRGNTNDPVTRDTAAAESTGGFTSDIIASAGDIVVLGPITATRTVRLANATPGASIRFVNASTFGTNGNDPLFNGIWRIESLTGQRVSGTALDNVDNDLVLNDRTANFDLVYANDQLGWMIID